MKEVQIHSVSKQQNPDFTAKSIDVVQALTSKGERGVGEWGSNDCTVTVTVVYFSHFIDLKPLNPLNKSIVN